MLNSNPPRLWRLSIEGLRHACKGLMVALAIAGCAGPNDDALTFSTWGSIDEIDTLNIYWARMKAMELAVAALGVDPGHVLVDGNRLPRWGWAATAIVGLRLAASLRCSS